MIPNKPLKTGQSDEPAGKTEYPAFLDECGDPILQGQGNVRGMEGVSQKENGPLRCQSRPPTGQSQSTESIGNTNSKVKEDWDVQEQPCSDLTERSKPTAQISLVIPGWGGS